MPEVALSVLGGVVAVVAALVTAIAEIVLASLRVGGVLVGASVLLAIAANLLLVWFTHRATGARWPVLLPAIAWFAVMLVAADRTTEGDLLVLGNWVGAALIIVGPIAFAAGGYQLIVKSRPDRDRSGLTLYG
jgi:hypothetical protein